MAVTIQSNIHNSDANNSLTNYALFLGGTNVTHDVLAQYDPLKTGYARLFMIRKPTWVANYFTNTQKFEKFKHILEYGNTSIQGLGDISVDMNQYTGGYTGKSFEIPSVARDDTNQFTVQVYEFSGSPIREVLHTWINGTVDILTGLTHYNGEIGKKQDGEEIRANQANQTAEFIYVVTDCTGTKPEYVCLFANCFPKGINLDPFNYTSGEHELVQTTIEFTCTKYESPQINAVGAALLKKYRILANSMNFHSGILVNQRATATDGYKPIAVNDTATTGKGTYYDVQTGRIETDSNDGGNWSTPAQWQLNTPLEPSTWENNSPSWPTADGDRSTY